MDTQQFLAQLQRRGVYRVAAIYSAAAWALLQVADVLFPIFGFGDGAVTIVLLVGLAGFPISLVLAWIFDFTSHGIVETPSVEVDVHQFKLSPARVAELGLIAILILLVGYLFFDRLKPQSEDLASQAISSKIGSARATIAVMPFVNSSDTPSMGYFGDGLAEEILNLLAKLGELNVSARTSSFYFKNKTVDIETIAAHLGVRYVLEGSVRHFGNRVRVTAQLIDATDSFHLWSETYERDISNLFTLQDDIASEVVGSLRVTLSPSSKDTLDRDFSVDPSAYDYYLRGRDYLRKPADNSTLANATELFHKALKLAPEYADAYAGLCDALLLRYQTEMDVDWFSEAENACLRAQQLDSRAISVHIALGNLYRGSGQYALSEQEFNRAIELQANAVDAYIGLANTFSANSKHALAEQILTRAIELQPNYWQASMAMGRYLFNAGRVEESIAYFRRIDDLLPESGAASNNLGNAYFFSGQFEEAVTAWEEAFRRAPTVDVYSNLGTSYFFVNRYDEAAEMYAKALHLAPLHFEGWGNLGDAYSHSTTRSDLAPAAYQRALELARAHLKINPSDAATFAMAGHYLAHLGEREQSLENVNIAQQLAQSDMYVYYFSASALCTLGELKRSIAALGNAIALGYPPHLIGSDASFSALKGLPDFEEMMVNSQRVVTQAFEGE